MKIKRNEKGNIEFTPEEFVSFLCEIGNEITAKLQAEFVRHITIQEATNAVMKDMGIVEPKLYEEISRPFNPYLFKQKAFNERLVVNVKTEE